MKIINIDVGYINTNCYIITSNNEALIIDPGGDSDKIIKAIKDNSLKPKLCLLTHGHYDHVLAAADIVNKYKIPLLMSQKDTSLLKESVNFEQVEKSIELVDATSTISLGGVTFQIFETPGHTPGSISLYCKDEKVVFVGDLIFADGYVGRTDFEYSNEEELRSSIHEILTMSPNTHVYSGHGPSFTIGEWKDPE